MRSWAEISQEGKGWINKIKHQKETFFFQISLQNNVCWLFAILNKNLSLRAVVILQTL